MISPNIFVRFLFSSFLAYAGASVSPGAETAVAAVPGLVSHFASFGTNRVHYLTAGQGTHSVLFVHGWACNAGFWREQVPALTNKTKLILVDLPGHGESDKPHTNYTMDFFAEAVVAVMRDTKVAKATLVGHSMGTPVICRAYALAPDRVAGLVAVDGLLRRPKIPAGGAESFIAPYRTPEYREQATRFVQSMFPNPGTEALRDQVLAEVLKTPQHVMSGAMDNMFETNAPAWDLPKVSFPVMALNAKGPMWTEAYETYVRSISSKTDYRALDGVGHFLMLEKPAEFNTALVAMLQQFDLVGK